MNLFAFGICTLVGAATLGVRAYSNDFVTDDHGNRPAALSAVATPAESPGGVIAGLEDWAALGPYGGDVADVAAMPGSPNIVLAGLAPSGSVGGALYRSTDSAASWTPVAQLAGKSVFDIEFAPGGVAYIGTEDGVWKSTNSGASWTMLNLNIGLNDQVFDVAVDPADSNRIFAGVADAIGNQPANVMRSPDAGQTWFDVSGSIPTISCRAIAFDPGNSQNVYAAFGGSFGGGQFWYSDNGGDSWVSRSAGLPNFPLNDVVHDGTRVLLCGGQAFGSQFVGLYSSTNHGQNWTPLHDASWTTLIINDIELFPAMPDIIMLATLKGVFRSGDGGLSWDFGVGGTTPLSLNSIRVATAGDPPVVYTGGASVAVWKSIDNATTFLPSSVGIGALQVFAVGANPRDQQELAIAFQGLNNGGIYTSTDGGLIWTLAPGLPGTRYSAVRFAPDGTLYVISSGPTTIGAEGLYRRNANGTWTPLGPDQGTLFESELVGLRFSENDPLLILTYGSDFGVAGHEATIWRSTTGGTGWTKVYEGPEPSQDVQDLEIVEDGTDQVMIACFTDLGETQIGGVLRSTTGGTGWAPSSTGLASEVQGSGLCPSPDDPQTFYLADNDFGTNLGGVFKTIDGGQSWAPTGYVGNVTSIVCEPHDPQVLYIMRQNNDRVLRSDNGGASFSLFNTGLASAGIARSLAYADGVCPKLLFSSGNGTFARDLGINTAADTNCDCAVNFLDIDPFLLGLFDPAGYQIAFPDCPLSTVDCDGSGHIDFLDIDPFIAILFGQ